MKLFKKMKKSKKIDRQESELHIKHIKGYVRGDLVIISRNLDKLKKLKEKLEERNIETNLLENYCGQQRDFKLDLVVSKKENNLKDILESYLEFADKYFVNGRPIKNIDFFTVSEWLILEECIGE